MGSRFEVTVGRMQRQAVLLFMWGDKPSRFARLFRTHHLLFGLHLPSCFVYYAIKHAILQYWWLFSAVMCPNRCCDCCSMDKIKVLVTGGQEEKDTSSLMDDVNESCKCSRKTRLYGFVICACIGFFISFLVRLSFACVFEIHPRASLSNTGFVCSHCLQS